MQRVDGVARRLVHPAVRLAAQQRHIDELGRRLARCHAQRMSAAAARFDAARRHLLWSLRRPLPQCAFLVQARDTFLRRTGGDIDTLAARLARLQQSLGHLNPKAVLERGYAIVAADDGSIVADANAVSVGDEVHLTFASGGAAARITATRKPD
jgi:exodeoxyribonuclease VII large subunit